MIPILLALAATAQAAPSPAEAKYRSCTALARSDPQRAVEFAERWSAGGGGLDARMCLGLAYTELKRWPTAASTFEQAALEAAAAQDERVSEFWVQAGNGWLAGDDPARARKAFDAALATDSLSPELRGEVHLDRARAAAAQNDGASARADIDKGIELVPGDAFAWYLSAALARREGNLARARTDIAKAVSLSPDDASILVEAGNIAGLSGEVEAAKGLYARAARLDPDSDAARRAAAALAANGGEETTPAPPAAATPQ